MSELIQNHDNRATIRWKLLTGVSAAALIASATIANAADDSRPTIWLELGGQAEAVSGQGQPFTSPFMTNFPTTPVFSPVSPLRIQKPPLYSFGGEASISFQPEESDWVFSAAIRYGRSNNTRHVHQQVGGLPVPTTTVIYQYFLHYHHFHLKTVGGRGERYADFKAHHGERHTILDFQAGKDVGLGMFGKDSNSVLSAGVRMARFNSNATIDIRARPSERVGFSEYFPKYYSYWTNYVMSGRAERTFHGIGPTVSWTGSVPLAGNPKDGELALDWGINGAVLFGKQRTKIHHNTTGHYRNNKYGSYSQISHNSANPSRSRSVTVPNIGGSVGISYRFVDAKIAIGYRYDTFLGAMDTGIDAVNKSSATFKGPYASISFGLGD